MNLKRAVQYPFPSSRAERDWAVIVIRGAVVVVVAGGAVVEGAPVVEVTAAVVLVEAGTDVLGPVVVVVDPPPPPAAPTQPAPVSTQPTWLSRAVSDCSDTYWSPPIDATATVATMSAYSGSAAPRSRQRPNQLTSLALTLCSTAVSSLLRQSSCTSDDFVIEPRSDPATTAWADRPCRPG